MRKLWSRQVLKLIGILGVAMIAANGAIGSTASAETLECGSTGVFVNDPTGELAEMVCDTVERAVAQFEQCNVPALNRPVQIDIVEDLGRGCTGVYHCGDDLIELLPPALMEGLRDPEGAFVDLETDEYFQSVVVHELAHAATEDLNCPFDACVAAQEYIAYAMRVSSLSPQQQQVFEERSALEEPVSSFELSVMIFYMAPHRFTQKVWAHFSQHDDPYGYFGQLMNGSILIDRERFQ